MNSINSCFKSKWHAQVTPLEEETSSHSDFRDILRLRGREAKTVQCLAAESLLKMSFFLLQHRDLYDVVKPFGRFF